jgi:hypothetical protein
LEALFLENLNVTPVYWIVGALDPKIPIESVRVGRDRLKGLKYELLYHEYADRGHEWFPEEDESVARWFLAHERARYPSILRLTTDELLLARHAWIELVAPKPLMKAPLRHLDKNGNTIQEREVFLPASKIKATAKRDRQRIVLEVQGAREVRVYLHDDLVDLGREFEVVANSRSVFKGRVERSVKFLLEEALRTGERDRLYWGQLTVRIP